MELIAEQDVQIISTKESLFLTAEKQIVIRVGGTYDRFSSAGIDMGTAGRWVAHASHHSMVGPATMASPRVDLPRGSINFNDSYILRDELTNEPLSKMRYEMTLANGKIIKGITGADGAVPMQEELHPDQVRFRLLGEEQE